MKLQQNASLRGVILLNVDYFYKEEHTALYSSKPLQIDTESDRIV